MCISASVLLTCVWAFGFVGCILFRMHCWLWLWPVWPARFLRRSRWIGEQPKAKIELLLGHWPGHFLSDCVKKWRESWPKIPLTFWLLAARLSSQKLDCVSCVIALAYLWSGEMVFHVFYAIPCMNFGWRWLKLAMWHKLSIKIYKVM